MKKVRTKSRASLPTQLSGKVITLQVGYRLTPAGLQTGRNIIQAKLRNSRAVLTNFRQSRERSGDDQLASALAMTQQRIQEVRHTVKSASSFQDLFLLEARAANTYWNAIRLLCMQSEAWRRVYPKANDPLNIILNTGYTILGRMSRDAIEQAGLLPQIGILHGTTTPYPIVYDFMEVFRQPLVDTVVIPIFSRKQRYWEKLPKRDARRAFQFLYRQAESRVEYKGRCEVVQTVMYREAIALRRAIEDHRPWVPYTHPWRHGKICS